MPDSSPEIDPPGDTQRAAEDPADRRRATPSREAGAVNSPSRSEADQRAPTENQSSAGQPPGHATTKGPGGPDATLAGTQAHPSPASRSESKPSSSKVEASPREDELPGRGGDTTQTRLPGDNTQARPDPHATAQYTGPRPDDGVFVEGDQFGKYTIERTLGRGGMGAVYLARDSELGRQVALKIPRLDRHQPQEVFDRFAREAKAAATTHHPNICPVYEYGQIDGQHFLAMAYIEGSPLSRYIKSGKPIAERQAALLTRKLARTLQEAHDHGVVHRDLKPSNIMIDRRKEPVVMDFGLARREQHDDTRLTQTGMFVGTPAYTSPEQIRNQPGTVGPATDIYTLGVILYELLTGKLPFEGSNTMALLSQVLTEEPPSVRERNPKVSEDLEHICQRAMAKAPDERYASMADLAKDLTSYLKGQRVAAVQLDDLSESDDPLADLEEVEGDDTGLSSVGLDHAQLSFLQTQTHPALANPPAAPAAAAPPQLPWLVLGGIGIAVLAVGLTVLAFLNPFASPGRLQIEVADAPSSLQIEVDGKPVTSGEANEGFKIGPGRHEVLVSARGFASEERTIDVVTGETTVVAIRLQEIGSRNATPQTIPSPAASVANNSPASDPAPPKPKDDPQPPPKTRPQPAVGTELFDDFESGRYTRWTVEGNAFLQSPMEMPAENSTDAPMTWSVCGRYTANSNEYLGPNIRSADGDRFTGRLSSETFTVTHQYINFFVFGGNHPGQTEIRLIVDDEVKRAATGFGTQVPLPVSWEVSDLLGDQARFEIVDEQRSYEYPFIAVDQIEFSDTDGVARWRDEIQQRIDTEAIEWNGHRYWFPEWVSLIWDSPDAIRKLENLLGTHLLTVNSPDELQFVLPHLRGATWLGLVGDSTGKFTLPGGRVPTYSNWLRGCPEFPYQTRVMMDKFGDWDNNFRAREEAYLVFEWGTDELLEMPIQNAAAQRQAAEAVRGFSEWMWLRTTDGLRYVSSNDELPESDFEMLGIRFRPGYAMPGATRLLFRNVQTITRLELPNTRDETLTLITDCPRLRQLSLSGGNFSGQVLRRLPRRSELRHLTLESCRLADQVFESFGVTRHLRVLNLESMPVTGTQLRPFTRNPNLEVLRLNATGELGNAGVACLPEFTQMRILMLWGCDLQDRQLTALSNMSEVVSLQLGLNGQLTGATLPALKECTKLRSLSVHNTSCSDAALAQLPAFPLLNHLSVGKTQIRNLPANLPQRYPALRHFDGKHLPVDDRLFGLLDQFPKLDRLSLQNTGVTTAATEAFKETRSRLQIDP